MESRRVKFGTTRQFCIIVQRKAVRRSLFFYSNFILDYCFGRAVPNSELIPGLPDDVALSILAMISHGYHDQLEFVCKKWRDTIRSEQYAKLKADNGWCGNWIFVFTDSGGWEAYDTEADRWSPLPVMPAVRHSSVIKIFGFSCVTVCNKLLLIGGHTLSFPLEILHDVSVFDPFKKEWYMGARMRRARHSFAYAAISGKVYVAGGHDLTCWLRGAEVYDPLADRWDDLPPMPFPLLILFNWSCGDLFYVVGRKTTSMEMKVTRIVFNTVEHQWQVLDTGNPYNPIGKSFVIDEWLYIFDEETVVALRQLAQSETSRIPINLWHISGRDGSCFVGSKQRLYHIGGLLTNFDIKTTVKLNSIRICDEMRLPFQWRDARPMLSEGGHIMECVVITE